MRLKATRSPEGSSTGKGRFGLAVLLATAAAFLLAPIAHAAAEVVVVNGAGSGSGEIKSTSFHTESGGEVGGGNVACSWNGETEEQTGVCSDTALNQEGYEILYAFPAEGSEAFVTWTFQKGVDLFEAFEFGFTCNDESTQKEGIKEFGGPHCYILPNESGEVEVTVEFNAEAGAEPFGVTASKTGSGNGWLHSQGPEYAINCGGPCTSKSATFEAAAEITASGAQFAGWEACPGSEAGRTCTLEAEGEAVAEYVANKSLTVTKTGSGNGWVHSEAPAYAINCGGPCTTKTGFFETGSEVTLTASGGEFTEWVSCPGTVAGRDCTVTLSESKAAEVKYGA